MTYCLAWKSGSSILAIADSAITRHGAGKPPVDFTTFGERTVSDPDRRICVYEGAAKIADLSPNAVYMFAGEVKLGDSLGRVIRKGIERGASVRAAFETALVSHMPAATGRVSPIVCTTDSGKKEIMTPVAFGQSSELKESEREDVGSMPRHMLALARQIAKYSNTPLLTEAERLVCATAIFQSLSIHEYLMEDGVGGVYQSVGINSHGIFRTPSCFYIMVENKLADGIDENIFVYMLKNAVLTRSNSSRFAKTLHLNSLQLDDLWQNIFFPEIQRREDVDAFLVDYVVVFRKSQNRILVLENKNHNGLGHNAFAVEGSKPIFKFNPLCEALMEAPRNPKAAVELVFLRTRCDRGYWTVRIGIPWEE